VASLSALRRPPLVPFGGLPSLKPSLGRLSAKVELTAVAGYPGHPAKLTQVVRGSLKRTPAAIP